MNQFIPLSKQELRKQIATDKELETVIQLMRQACVSAYEDGQAQKTAARLQLDEDYIRSRLLAWRAAYSKQREVEAFDEGWEACEKQKPVSILSAIQFRQEQYGWNDAKMAAMLDLSRAHYSEFKHGKRGLPVNSIRKAYAIGIPASVLLADAPQPLSPEQKERT